MKIHKITGEKQLSVPASGPIYFGIDLHNRQWQVTIRTEDVELFHGSIPGNWEALQKLLDRYVTPTIHVVYEAGYFGYWLHDRLVEYGAADCIVTPPSLILQESGNRVKTDRLDSRKLAMLLSRGMLKRVWVPDREGLGHRQIIRRRRQLVRDRVRVQCRMKAELRFYGIEFGEHQGRWSKKFVERLRCLNLGDRWKTVNFRQLIDEYDYLDGAIRKQNEMIKELASLERYNERAKILQTVPGIGLLAAMEILVELQDVSRFQRAKQLAAYVGLTPSQYSSGEHVRMGHISRCGTSSLRGVIVEIAWRLIMKDEQLRKQYEEIKRRAGAKRAIVAIARRILLRVRRMLLDGMPYCPRPMSAAA